MTAQGARITHFRQMVIQLSKCNSHNWVGLGLKWWRSYSLNKFILFELWAWKWFTVVTSIYILASSKGWSNIDSGYKSYQQVNKCIVCERQFTREKVMFKRLSHTVILSHFRSELTFLICQHSKLIHFGSYKSSCTLLLSLSGIIHYRGCRIITQLTI